MENRFNDFFDSLSPIMAFILFMGFFVLVAVVFWLLIVKLIIKPTGRMELMKNKMVSVVFKQNDIRELGKELGVIRPDMSLLRRVLLILAVCSGVIFYALFKDGGSDWEIFFETVGTYMVIITAFILIFVWCFRVIFTTYLKVFEYGIVYNRIKKRTLYFGEILRIVPTFYYTIPSDKYIHLSEEELRKMYPNAPNTYKSYTIEMRDGEKIPIVVIADVTKISKYLNVENNPLIEAYKYY